MKVINSRSWISRDLCDYIYLPEFDEETPSSPPDSGIIYCPLDQIADFFLMCQKTDNKYIVVSACSDFGLHLQEVDPIGNDMQKWLPMQDVTGIGYSPAIIPPRCNVDRCKIADKFSVKMYSFTRDTFDSVPDNVVAWYSTNLNIDSSNIGCLSQSIPFGIGNPEIDILSYRKPLEDKENRIYFNWTNNTNERVDIKKYYKNHPDIYTSGDKSYTEYLQELADSKFVMCPEGNGLDSYRIWESIYVGSIPIIHRDHWSNWMSDLPVILCDHKGIPSREEMMEYVNSLDENEFNHELLDLDWWFDHINESRELL